MSRIIGSGGGGKGGAGGGGISEDPDTLQSVAFARFVDLIGEGEIKGLVHGESSIYLDGVPLRDTVGTPNYKPFQIKTTLGTQAQSPIPGFTGTVQENAVGLQLTLSAGAIVRSIDDADADSVRVTLAVNSFSSTSSEGKVGATTVDYKIWVRVTSGSWVSGYEGTLTGKTNSRYQKSHEISLTALGAGPYEVKVERITADSTSALLANNLYWDSFAVINYEPFSYPNSALVAVEIDGRYFSSVPQRAYHVQGLIVQVPSNYNAVTRVYTGVWDGTWQLAYTNNPAWCFYDIVTNGRYGLGKRISENQISKWVMYQIAKYCDEPVPTGQSGNIFSTSRSSSVSSSGTANASVPVRNQVMEPRFTLNCVINTKEDAYKVLNNLSSVFRGMSYWASGQVMLTQDRPTITSMQWTNANVIDGMFTYEGSARTDRHTTCTVAWNDPAEDFRQRFEYVEDRDGIVRYGVRPMDMTAFGCTSRSQARRVGLWLLYTERIEKDAIKFRAGLDSANVMPGDVGKIMDSNRVGTRWGGRVISATTTVVTLDAPLVLSAGTYTLSVMARDGTVTDKAVNIATGGTFTALTVAIAFGEAPAVMAIWTLASTVVVPMLGRVIQITQANATEYDIVCLEHNPSKYAAIELGAAFDIYDYSFLSFDHVPTVTNLHAVENSFKISVSSVVQTNVEISWDAIADPLIRGYRLSVGSAAGNSFTHPEQRDAFYTLLNVSPGTYTFTVVAVNQLGIVGPPAVVTLAVLGVDTTPPANVTGFVSVILRDGVRFTWDANTAVDYLETELHLESTWHDATVPIFVGRASTWTWASPPNGAYDVVAKHRDTSGNMSVTAAHVNDTVPTYVPPADGAAGADGITFVLSNEAHTVASDVNGNVPSFAGADTFISAYVGGVYSTSLWTYTKTDVNLHSYFQPGVPNHVIVDAMGGTKLLLHASEAAGTFATADSSAGHHNIFNPNTDVALSASHAKFDQALHFPGTEDSYLEVAWVEEFALRAQDFAIQFQVYIPSMLSERQFVIGWWGPGTATTDHSWAVLVGTDGKLNFDYASLLDVADYTITSTADVPTGVVTECGVSRIGNVLTLKVGTVTADFAFDKTIRTIGGDSEAELPLDTYRSVTTILYPTLVEESMGVSLATLQRGDLIRTDADTMSLGVPALHSGTLDVTISYLTYDRTAYPETMSIGVPTLQSGTLATAISYLTYDRTAYPETMSIGVPTLQSGTLAVTITYVTYNNALNEDMSIGVPTLISGTLV